MNAKDALRVELEASHAQAERLRAPGFPRAALEAVQAFQRRRLARTYDDLSRQPRYGPAVQFFLEELYGGRDAQARDRQVAKALPIMQATLPGRLQETLADAFRLQALSMELDIRLAEGLQRDGGSLDVARYAELYPEVPRARREDQIALIHQLALELDRVVRLPLVLGLIKAMRGPARAAGFSALQAFLERGLRAFRTLRGAVEFADIVRRRETRIMNRLYAGAQDPFGDPPEGEGGDP